MAVGVVCRIYGWKYRVPIESGRKRAAAFSCTVTVTVTVTGTVIKRAID